MTAAPGPYNSARSGKPGGKNTFTVILQDGNKRTIATVYGAHDGEKEETAALLAAAPAMLKVLEQVALDGEHIKPKTLDDVRRTLYDISGKIVRTKVPK